MNSKNKYNNPIPVSAIIIEKDFIENGAIFPGIVLIKRKNEPEKGQFVLPAGFVNEFEHPKDAAKREAFEETGLIVTNLKLLDVYLSQRNHIVFFYHCHIPFYLKEYPAFENVKGILKAGDDAEECKIISLRDKKAINAIPFETHVLAINKYIEEFC